MTALVFAAAAVVSPFTGNSNISAKAPKLDLSGIARYVYPNNGAASPGSQKFMPDGETYLSMSGGKIVKYSIVDGKEIETVFDQTNTRENTMKSPLEGFQISPDGSKLLVWCDSESVYRHSKKATYYIYEIKRRILRPLSKDTSKQQAPLFSPDSRMVAFVVNNNIRVRKYDYDTELPVTTDGAKNKIINGVPDWTYEEEFATAQSMAWAPDNSVLCFLKYNETDVPLYSLKIYGGSCNPRPEYALYPGSYSYKYPVAGEPNSKVTIHIYDVDNRKIKDVKLPDDRIEYIPRIAFGGNSSERLMAVTLNREQNRMEIYAVNPRSTVSKSIIVEEAKSAWLNPMTYENLKFEPECIMMFSERSGWNHLQKYSYAGQLLSTVTSGDYDVTDYYGTDNLGNIYYQAEPSTGTPADAINRVVYRYNAKTRKTEALSPAEGWASATFSPGLGYYTLNYSNAVTPPVYTLFSTKGKGKQLRVIQDNAEYAARYATCQKKEFFTMNTGGVTLNGYMIKPANFSSSKKYPVIMWQYSGPGSQEVCNRWGMDWGYYAAEQGFLVVAVDGRGTGGRGTEFRNVVYKRLGIVETEDQVVAAKYVASLPYADGNNIGIGGWSFGGYESLMCATEKDAPFAAAVAIAPVTSWRYYDTIYTERYMLTPQQNASGYDTGAPLTRAGDLQCPLLLMYGTADDNVHPENSIEFVSRLQINGLECDMFIFPNMNHSIYGCNSRAVVYSRMLGFFTRQLKK